MNAALTFSTKRTFKAKQIINDFFAYIRKPLYIFVYVLGFVRIKLGFGYGVALHRIWFIDGFSY